MKRSFLIVLVSTILAVGLYAGGEPEVTEPTPNVTETEITTMDVPYTVGGQNFIGYLAYDRFHHRACTRSTGSPRMAGYQCLRKKTG
jgi:hypothetical protein